MKNILYSLLFVVSFAEAAPEVVVHPAPKEPVYLKASWYSEVKKTIAAPPIKGSPQQAADEKELFQYQESRNASDCAQAKEEVRVSLRSFFGGANLLDEKTVIRYSAFFEQLRNDIDYFVQLLKKDYPRPRPFTYLKLDPCVPREVTGAYPSGHAVISKVFAQVLSDLNPAKKDAFEKRAQTISDHRVLSGMHHRSDVEAGRTLADMIYTELKKSDKFRTDLATLSKNIK